MQSGFLAGTQGRATNLFTPKVEAKPASGFTYDKSLIALASSWPGLICDTTIRIHDYQTEIVTTRTPPAISMDGRWVQIIGKSNAGGFTIFLTAEATGTFLQLTDANLDLSKLEGGDAAIILEHLFTNHLNLLEELLGAELSVSSITDVSAPVSGELLGFEFMMDGALQKGALQITGELHQIVEQIVGQNSFPEERAVDDRLVVHLGPVVVTAKQAYLARPGEMIDCGVEPSAIIKGVLMRSDGRYWPIFIEDESVEIAGELAGPVQFNNESQDTIFVTFGLGDVHLSAFDRRTLATGTKVNVQRLHNNEAEIYYQARPFGKGSLSILGTNLAVTLSSIGSF
jgi:hypothetical protein